MRSEATSNHYLSRLPEAMTVGCRGEVRRALAAGEDARLRAMTESERRDVEAMSRMVDAIRKQAKGGK